MVIIFFFLNNKIGGDTLNILSFWKVGKFVEEKMDSCFNPHEKCSNFLSYYYGNSNRYSLNHILMMKKLYSYFPIYINCMDEVCWDSYLELLKLNPEECYFYYRILLFCGDNSLELKRMIQSNLYFRIQKTDN